MEAEVSNQREDKEEISRAGWFDKPDASKKLSS